MRVEAIYVDGVLKPVEEIDLAELQRVRLTIEPADMGPGENGSDVSGGAARGDARRQLVEFLKNTPLRLTGRLPRRDELYDDRV